LQKDEEVTLVKVPAEGVDRLRARLRELHPYELPEFVVLDVDLSGSLPEYVAWVRACAAGEAA
jgi:periplasmic divalent cation tolerance protein